MLVLRCGPVPLPSKGKEDGALLTHRDEHFHLGVAGVGKLLVERRDGLGWGGGGEIEGLGEFGLVWGPRKRREDERCHGEIFGGKALGWVCHVNQTDGSGKKRQEQNEQKRCGCSV